MSFLKDLEKLNRPAPALPDLEDNDIDDTSSKAAKFAKPTEEDADVAVGRRRIINVHLDEDGKYGGSKVSRSEMFGESSEMTGIAASLSDSEGSGEDNEDEEDIASENISQDNQSLSDEQEDEESDISESELTAALDDSKLSDTEDLDDEEFSDEEEEGDESAEEDADQTPVEELMSKVDKSKESKKADAVRTQLNIWDQLLYLKIKTHSALRAFNQLPREKLARDLLKESSDETKQNIKEAQKNSVKLLNMLLEAENLLLAGSSLTKGLVGESGGMADSDDEEIESSEDECDDDAKKNGQKLSDAEGSEDLDESDNDDDEDQKSEQKKRLLSAKQASKKLVENDKLFEKFRNLTLTKWDERTRLTGPRNVKEAKKDFSAFGNNDGVVKQIDKIMADKARILKRCHTKRSDVDRIGGDPQVDEDPEIFDDDDFYQVLLKELIDKKTNATNDPVAMTRHYIEMQKLKNKRSKKRVFVKNMSKDRAIKYITIPKLVNFHPARPEYVKWSHETRNELFKSLFA